MRAIKRYAPWSAFGTVARHRDPPEPKGAAHRLWYGVVPYLLSTLSVALALAVRLLLVRFGVLGLRDMRFTLFLFAIAVSTWYLGTGPGVLAAILSALAYGYFLGDPQQSFSITAAAIPFYVASMFFALLVTRFTAVRRRAEQELIHSRDQLRMEIAERQKTEEEVRRLNEQLAKRTADLEIANRELEAFAYSTSHDLRAPVRHMLGFTELLQRHAQSNLDEKSRRYVSTILDAARRMGALIDDLLAFSRIGRVESQEATVDLGQLVREGVEQMRVDSRGRTISWRIGDLPVVYGDRSMLRLVFVNLIANAIKFTRPRETAEIEIGSLEDERGLVVFVKDNGVGFDMHYSNKLFRVFQRLHATEEFEGTGIGLATAQRIIHRHGGAMWAEGAVNGGATFFFSLPPARKR